MEIVVETSAHTMRFHFPHRLNKNEKERTKKERTIIPAVETTESESEKLIIMKPASITSKTAIPSAAAKDLSKGMYGDEDLFSLLLRFFIIKLPA